MKATNSPDCLVAVASKDAVACEFGDGIALLDLNSNCYYSLNKVGAIVWNEIQAPARFDAVVSAVMDVFDVDSKKCSAEIKVLLDSLADAGLATLNHARTG